MPAYNEQDGIEAAISEVRSSILDKVDSSFLLVVNDGSTDTTGTTLDRLASTDSRIQVAHRSNSGHGPTLVWALNQAESEYVFLIDSDMQIALDCFQEFWQIIREKNVDGVFGVRAERHDPAFRRFLSKFISLTLSGIFKVKVQDANAPCKLFRRTIWNDLYQRIQDDTLMAPSLVIAIFAERRNYKIVRIPIVHRERQHGTSTLRFGKLMRFCWKAFGQVLTIKDRLE
ncbi:MAG TPA: glycosyltransferase [Planktothrix sp.]